MIRTFGRLLTAFALLLSACEPAYAASTTPPNLIAATSVANTDLLLVWPTASTGPLESVNWSTLKAQLTTDLATTWLRPSQNLADLGNVTTARASLGVTATGADTAYAFRANNLSDLANAATARTNLQVPQTTTASWSPVVTFATPGNLNVVYSLQSAQTVKIGGMCFANFRITTTTFTFTTASGNVQITGLTPAPTGAFASASSGTLSSWAGMTGITVVPTTAVNASSVITLQSASGSSSLTTANFTTATNVTLGGNLAYPC